MACDPLTMPDDADCFDCIPPGMQAAVQSYLLARIRGGSMDVNQIVRDAACLTSCIPPGLLPRIRSYLLCQLSNTGGGVIPESECDADALAFIAAAGITVEEQKNAICRFVASLKSQGTPPFWDSEVLLYPFIGGTANAHSYNLANPATFQLTYHGAPAPTHGPLGMLGNAAGGAYANTHYSPRNSVPALSTSNARCCIYFDFCDGTINRSHHGAQNGVGESLMSWNAALNSIRFKVFENPGIGAAPFFGNGNWLHQTNGLNNQTVSYNGGAFSNSANPTTNTPTSDVYILGLNNLGLLWGASNSRVSGFSVGTRQLSAAEWPIYNSIWQTFQDELGRQRP